MIELQLPIKTFWEVESDLKNIDYMLTAHEDFVTINDKVLRLMRKVEPFTVSERDRIFLRGRFGGQTPSPSNGNSGGG